ncbi:MULTISPECIES: S41 family peptidase [Gammaproteobacteria]|uniref:PDZ domain-containing protein n=1 Tax=Vreelandella halophila TaxID=86177 RepID=A0A9X5B709_9GAMM|nr:MULTISPECIES: S41 family peptidase [Gammaproteobacteria]KAA8978056.1 S41 family peptidase [Halospina sp. K52047b]MYL28079.1 PDZ domain-containing protein [Halomonas utahensis]MYL75754.1 PDZ domain-containing protein [Halomonas sp. 22501_18_FS]
MRHSSRNPVTTLALSLVLTLTALPGVAAEPMEGEDNDPTRNIDNQPPVNGQTNELEVQLADPEKQLPLDELRKFTEVFERIKRGYVEEVSDKELLNKAIDGMLSGLDPHSAYLEPEAFSQLEESTSGEFGGLGIEVGMEDGFVRVISPIDGTPAQEAGVQAGDLIIEIDGTPVKGMSLEEAVKEMRGEPGTTIDLTIGRDGESSPIEVTIERAIIEVDSVRSRMLEPGYGYIRISQFQQNTGQEFRTAYEELVNKHGNELDGVVLDLRNNPGGVLEAAVDVADSLINEGRIVYTKGRIESSQLSFDASPGGIAENVPIVALINSGSASASEILAGALQDQRRAVIMGTKSFGKGSVQTVMPLGDSHGIKLTTARYYTPDGRSIQAKGIEPDIEVRPAELRDVESARRFSEADLPGHLENGQKAEEKSDDTGTDESEEEAQRKDYQLRSALNLLKGMRILTPEKDKAAGTKSEGANGEAD